jgi:hypothetical protein
LICEYGPVVHPGSNVEWGEVYIASKIREVDDPASADRASDLTLDFPILVDRSVFLSVEWQIFPMKFELAAAQRAALNKTSTAAQSIRPEEFYDKQNAKSSG